MLADCGPSARSAPADTQPAPATATPASAPTAANNRGRQLIGELVGPRIVVGAGQFPKKFVESPLLAEPPPKIKPIMDKFERGFTVPEEERVKLVKEIWQADEDVHTIAPVRLSPAAQDTLNVKNTMGNIATRPQQPGR